MREPPRVIVEALLVAVVGVGIALAANAMNPHGLRLGYNYFQVGVNPTSPSTQPVRTTASKPDRPTVESAPAQPADDPYAGLDPDVRHNLEMHGLLPIGHDDAVAAFDDPLFAAGYHVFIDARADKYFSEGHIPGAYQIYYYEVREYAPPVAPFIQGAEKIVVYCEGGQCEDSVLLAKSLRDEYGLDGSKIFVYTKGFEGWEKAGLPVERGARGSGDIVQGTSTTEGGQ